MSTTAWRAGAFLAAVSLVFPGALVMSAPAGAAASVIRVAGDFVGDDRDEIFEYRPGNGSDIMYYGYTKDSGSVQTGGAYSFSVVNTYTPFAGDFDGDGKDELFFFGPGNAGDFIWDFDDVGGKVQTPKTQGGLYLPVVGDFDGNGIDDIFWYAPGSAPDELWEFLPGPGLPHQRHDFRNFTGDYVPLAGNFSADSGDEIILYGRGAIADHRVDFEPGTFTPIVTGAEPITYPDHQPVTLDTRGDGITDILFYNAATIHDPLWNFLAEGGPAKHNEQISGTYATAAGDLFGDGYEDVFWFGSTSSMVWDWEGGRHPTVRGFGVST